MKHLILAFKGVRSIIDVYGPHSPTHVGGRESDLHFALLSVLANLHSFPLFNGLL